MRIALIIICLFFMGHSRAAQDDEPITIYLDTELPAQHRLMERLEQSAESLNLTLTFTLDDALPRMELVSNNDDTVTFTLHPADAPSSLVNLVTSQTISHATLDDPALQSALAYLSGDCHHITVDSAALTINCAIQISSFEQALALYERLEPNDDVVINEIVQRNVAWVYLQSERPEDAFNIVDDIVSQYRQNSDDPHFPSFGYIDTLTFRAQLHALNFDYDAAISDMDNVVALSPDEPAHYVTRGQMVLLLYEWDRVEENYNRALAIDPTYAPAYYYRGLLYYTILERELALADFEAYQQFAPDGELAQQATDYTSAIRAELDALNAD